MDNLYLLKLGEIHLKGENKKEFISALRVSLKQRLSSIPHRLEVKDGRFYLHAPAAMDYKTGFVLNHLPGINAWARCQASPKNMDAITDIACRLMTARLEAGLSTFKVESRRADKGFPLDSYGISRELGHRICERLPTAVVNVHDPQTIVYVEIRERVYIYTNAEQGIRGLPVGCAGRGLLLLSGGIDSPVAGFQMLRRGLALAAAYFNAYPYTSKEAWEKVRCLASKLAAFSGGIELHTIPFTEVQLKINKDATESCRTLYLRAAMMLAADLLCQERHLNCIVTGESLSQVASQTAENMRFSQSFTDFAVMRPLCGTDKEDIIRTARQIDTYETSILPYEDCCVLFSPKHPVIKADFAKERELFQRLELGELIQAAVASRQMLAIQSEMSLQA